MLKYGCSHWRLLITWFGRTILCPYSGTVVLIEKRQGKKDWRSYEASDCFPLHIARSFNEQNAKPPQPSKSTEKGNLHIMEISKYRHELSTTRCLSQLFLIWSALLCWPTVRGITKALGCAFLSRDIMDIHVNITKTSQKNGQNSEGGNSHVMWLAFSPTVMTPKLL